MPPMSRRHLAALGLLGAGAAAYPFLAASHVVSTILYDVVGIAAMVLALRGVALNRPRRRGTWLLLIGGFSAWVGADLVTSFEQHVWVLDFYPVPSDAIYLASYALLAAGVLAMVGAKQPGRDVTALLDAAIIATGAAVVVAVFLIAPLARDSELSTLGKVVSSTYPIADVMLIAVIVRMWTSSDLRSHSYRLLVSALGLTLAGDIIWNVLAVLDGSQADRWSDQLYLSSYVVFAAAACVPSMTTLTEPTPDRPSSGSSHRRLVVLAGGLMLPSVALLVDGATGGGVLWPVIGLGAILLSALVLVRMSGILSIVETQATELSALARSDALTGAPNRRTWDHELARACVASLNGHTPLAVAMIDLDNFKLYNDAHGHQAGDVLLRDAVALWTARLLPGEILARYGGEEFTVLLPGHTAAEARTRIEELRGLTPDGQTFSAGVSDWVPGSEPTAAVAHADQALYQAKRDGRARVVVYVELPVTSAAALAGA